MEPTPVVEPIPAGEPNPEAEPNLAVESALQIDPNPVVPILAHMTVTPFPIPTPAKSGIKTSLPEGVSKGGSNIDRVPDSGRVPGCEEDDG